MSKTRKGSKRPGYEIWSKRADGKCSGYSNGWYAKRRTAKYERRKAKNELRTYEE